MDEKIKAKAQEVRLALLEQLGKEVAEVATLDNGGDRRHVLPELVSMLNQLDPSCAGIGGYLSATLSETAPAVPQ